MQPEYFNFADWGFKALISGCLLYLVNILGGLKVSIDSLNVKMATIIERVAHHEKRIERLEIKSEE
jgi:hypothetical protein